MGLTFSYTEARTRLRISLSHRERMLEGFRLLRYALVQGPWRPSLIRHYERSGENPRLPVHPGTMFPGIDPATMAAELERDACAARFRVPERVVDEVVAWTRDVGAKRIDDPHLDCPGVHRIAHDPAVVAVARGFLRAEPILFTSKLYWTRPPADEQGRRNAAAEGGRFHYDVADIKAVTLFVYLTDVDAASGPHIVIPGTQTRRTLPQILRRAISDDEAERRFRGRIQTITGGRGTCWFEDICCFHKQAPGSRERLALSIIYSLHRRPPAPDARRPAANSDSRHADRVRRAVERAAGELVATP